MEIKSNQAEILIREVKSKKDFSTFLQVPWIIYQQDPYWVPPLLSEQRRLLDRSKNPFFKHSHYASWIAFRSRQVVGRILAYVDHEYNRHYQEKKGFIGFFECIDEQETGDQLFLAANQWLKAEGMESVCGPMNFSIGNECGVQLDAFDSMPYLQMNHTPPYYKTLFEKAGFQKAHDLYAYKLVVKEINENPFFQKLKIISEKILQKEDLVIRPVNMKDYHGELERINTIFNKSMQQNWGFVPSDMEEVLFTADALKMIADPDIILFAEYKGQIVGCSISLPDINQVLIHLNGKLFPFGWLKFLYYKPKINRVRVYLLSVLEENRFKGLDAVFYYQSIMNGMAHRYEEAELSWISEDNSAMISIVEKIGAIRYLTYRMYEKEIH